MIPEIILDIDTCLDTRNRKFYEEHIENALNLKLISSNTASNEWRAMFKDDSLDVFILAGNDYPNIESFTHEMLHIYLFANGFNTFGKTSICFFSKLHRTLVEPNQTIDGIMNAISHFKMLPIFTDQLGMRKDKFFPNHVQFVNDERIEDLLNKFHKDITFKSYHFTNFIRTFFDLRYAFSEELKASYENFSYQLKELELDLYNILENNCLEWEHNLKEYDNSKFFNSLYKQLDDYL